MSEGLKPGKLIMICGLPKREELTMDDDRVESMLIETSISVTIKSGASKEHILSVLDEHIERAIDSLIDEGLVEDGFTSTSWEKVNVL